MLPSALQLTLKAFGLSILLSGLTLSKTSGDNLLTTYLNCKSQTMTPLSVAAASQYLIGLNVKLLITEFASKLYNCFPSFKSQIKTL
jgi:hypothetical protein